MRSIDRAPATPRLWRSLPAAALLTLSAWGAGCATFTGATATTPPIPRGAYAVVDGKVTPVPDIPMGDERTIKRIIREGQNDNRTLAHMTELCETFGARLTGSTSCENAAQWAQNTFSSWGLNRARLDWWGNVAVRFDRGPSRGVAIIPADGDPDRVARELQFTTLSWTRGTDGPLRAPVIPMPASERQLDALGDRLSGAWVLVPPDYADQGNIRRSGQLMRQRLDERDAIRNSAEGGAPLLARVLAMNPAGFISSSLDERVWTTSANGWRERSAGDYPQDIEVNVRQSDYDFLNSRVADGAEVLVEFDLPHAISDGPIPCYNVVAEITGVEKPNEVVICSAHLDSWDGPGSQGAIDNATGVSVVMEAARLLTRVGVRPKRTIRFILWTGEEQGLLGSRAYVANLAREDLDRISAVFVDDGGTNYEGGLPAADYMVDYLAAATSPVNGHFFSQIDHDSAMSDDDKGNDFLAGYMNVNIRPTGASIQTHSGSDHAPFNAVGVPGFFWDETGRANYRWAWHTQRDRLDQAIDEYLAQSSTNMAVVAYNLAMAPDLLPRSAADGTGLANVETAAPALE